jgi:predicted DNA-binding protein with PD1-like motif
MRYTIQKMIMGAYALFLGFVPFIGNHVSSESLAVNPPQNGSRNVTGNTLNPSSVATGKFNRVLVIRLKKGEELLEGLRKAVAQEKVNNGVFLGAFGSLTSYHVHVVDNTTFPPKNVYMKGQGPYDILSITGAVIGGKLHPHLTFADSKEAMGGHLEEGSRVFTFAVITLGVFEDGISLDRFDDWNWN